MKRKSPCFILAGVAFAATLSVSQAQPSGITNRPPVTPANRQFAPANLPPFTNRPPWTNPIPPWTNRMPRWTNPIPRWTNPVPPWTKIPYLREPM